MTDESSVPWEGDVNDAVIEDWKEETTAFDRLTTVLDTTSEPATVSELAERARISEPTVRKYIKSLCDVGRAARIETKAGSKFKRSPQTLALRRISTLHAHHTKADLRDGLKDLREKIQDLRETHGADDPDDLARRLEAGSDGWTDVARWKDLEENLDILKAALDLYDYDPDDEVAPAATVDAEDEQQRTALAGFDQEMTA